MAALLHFEEKVHKHVLRGQTPFFYFSLGCYAMFWRIWVSLQTLILSIATIIERASLLTNGIRYDSISIPHNFPSQGKSSTAFTSIYAPSTSAPYEPVLEAASSDAPPAVPPTSEPPITILGAKYRDLLASFQTLTTTQTTIMEWMDHFQLWQDQQTLILREIQQHLGLLPPAPPVAPMLSEPSAPADDATPVVVPSTVAAEDPSYPPYYLIIRSLLSIFDLVPYYQEVSLPPFYYHLLLEHWGQCYPNWGRVEEPDALSLYWLGVTDLTARYMGGWVSYLMTLVDD
ncbi:hypothetical protein CK203_087228 [Vitis vinifera]|uniref:Uncharacterized protein n=1 Tax=Vitis vinifera TaxID=29760 RepID=A0A438BS05_VITVI|nr:hypothetical protein CK203_087228 [Vitis vinifera]